ncbi:methylenetetrahydrofolate reductase [NAD(P)H] [Methylohalobius crimeensis]|uniref:methylenetetrahydrofolate reductase [NAD(P)H] n=1 Tax=Methylohalobius crimeensis TaxID=244365 RepID=UPI0003B76437|nr:methylenetetrahydrofolate reductase [NAD(P)H] [Methylohalobius crimeensis]
MKTNLSFEFFPPRSAKIAAQLRDTYHALARLDPVYFSVTYGAGGSTRDKTLETVLEIRRETGLEAVPHLSCIGSSQEEIRRILAQYRENGIRRIVALRGDLPSGMRADGDFRYASELVKFVRAETGDYFHIEVAAYPEAHPQAASYKADLRAFQRKVEAGADGAITQYFYNPDAYFYFLEDCRREGIEIPIVPGIMPITNYQQLARFSDLCGAEIPRWIRKQLESFGDDLESIRAFGVDVVTGLCDKLLQGGAPGLHFYTLNRAEPTLAICRNLDLVPR